MWWFVGMPSQTTFQILPPTQTLVNTFSLFFFEKLKYKVFLRLPGLPKTVLWFYILKWLTKRTATWAPLQPSRSALYHRLSNTIKMPLSFAIPPTVLSLFPVPPPLSGGVRGAGVQDDGGGGIVGTILKVEPWFIYISGGVRGWRMAAGWKAPTLIPPNWTMGVSEGELRRRQDGNGFFWSESQKMVKNSETRFKLSWARDKKFGKAKSYGGTSGKLPPPTPHFPRQCWNPQTEYSHIVKVKHSLALWNFILSAFSTFGFAVCCDDALR